MKWNKFRLRTTTQAEDIVSSILMDLGIQGIEIEDKIPLTAREKEQMFVDILPDGPADDGIAYLSFFVEEKENGLLEVAGEDKTSEQLLAEIREELSGLQEFMDIGEGTVSVDETEDIDWINNWKQYFHPLSIGEKFLICPSWEKVPGEGRTVIEIDPACSFGTGRHETTALCLEELEKQDIAGKDVLDMGCGSGILGIAALKLGAKHVDAVDIDMVATRIAGENAEKNGIPEGLMDIYCGNILTDGTLCESLVQNSYSLILANIVADIISDMLPFFARCLDAQGHMICSGIISPHRDFVVDALGKAGFVIESIREKNEWVAIVCRKS